MKKFKIERDSFGDIIRYILTDNIYIEREMAKNFTRTSSKYYLYKDGKQIQESGYGSGYSLKDLKQKAISFIR